MSFIRPTSLSLFKPDIWACILGLRAYYFKPNQLPPQPLAKAGVGKAVSLHGSGVTSTWLLGDDLIGAMSPSNVL